MKIEIVKMPVTPGSIIDRLIAPAVFLWTGLRILMWGEGFIKIPFAVMDEDEIIKIQQEQKEEDEKDDV